MKWPLRLRNEDGELFGSRPSRKIAESEHNSFLTGCGKTQAWEADRNTISQAYYNAYFLLHVGVRLRMFIAEYVARSEHERLFPQPANRALLHDVIRNAASAKVLVVASKLALFVRYATPARGPGRDLIWQPETAFPMLRQLGRRSPPSWYK
jgi:hypothetical protein